MANALHNIICLEAEWEKYNIGDRKSYFFLLFILFHNLFNIVQIDCIITTLLCTHKLNINCKTYGTFRFLFCRRS